MLFSKVYRNFVCYSTRFSQFTLAQDSAPSSTERSRNISTAIVKISSVANVESADLKRFNGLRRETIVLCQQDFNHHFYHSYKLSSFPISWLNIPSPEFLGTCYGTALDLHFTLSQDSATPELRADIEKKQPMKGNIPFPFQLPLCYCAFCHFIHSLLHTYSWSCCLNFACCFFSISARRLCAWVCCFGFSWERYSYNNVRGAYFYPHCYHPYEFRTFTVLSQSLRILLLRESSPLQFLISYCT